MELRIEKLVYGGDGLARIENGGRAKSVFVPFVLEDERVEAIVVEERSSFARARVERVLEASPERVLPGCEYFSACGGCHYQHAGHDHQVQVKQQVLRETLLRTGKIDWKGEIAVHAAEPWGYRNRSRLHVRAAKAFTAGYFRAGSHDLLSIRHCPISSPLINLAIEELWHLGEAAIVPQALREIEFLVNEDDSQLLVGAYVQQCSAPITDELQKFYDQFTSAMPQMRGMAAFAASSFVSDPLWHAGETEMEYRVADWSYQLRASTFFQVNRFLGEKLIELLTRGRHGDFALDLYAGTGLFTLPLQQNFEAVTAVEASPASCAELRENSGPRVEVFEQTTEEFLAAYAGAVPEYVIVDPPRAGLGMEVCAHLARMAPARIGYLSCDPATLSRDLRVLVESGYRVESVQLVDLFPQTFHIETAVQLVSRRNSEL